MQLFPEIEWDPKRFNNWYSKDKPKGNKHFYLVINCFLKNICRGNINKKRKA